MTKNELGSVCKMCGACCHQRPGCIPITQEDIESWGRTGDDDMLTSVTAGHFGEKAFAIGPNGACVHLGTHDNPNACSKYAVRAAICREFKAGCPQCHEFRRDRGKVDE